MGFIAVIVIYVVITLLFLWFWWLDCYLAGLVLQWIRFRFDFRLYLYGVVGNGLLLGFV